MMVVVPSSMALAAPDGAVGLVAIVDATHDRRGSWRGGSCQRAVTWAPVRPAPRPRAVNGGPVGERSTEHRSALRVVSVIGPASSLVRANASSRSPVWNN
jgi:hypothetical protein